MRYKIISLSLKLTATTVALVFLVVAVYALLAVRDVSEDVERQTERLVHIRTQALEEVGASTTRYLGLPAASLMYDNDLQGLYSLIQPVVEASSSNDVVFAYIVAENGRVWVAAADAEIEAFVIGAGDTASRPFYRATGDPFAPALMETVPALYLAAYREAASGLPVGEEVTRSVWREGTQVELSLLQHTAAIVDREGTRLGFLTLAYSLEDLRAEVESIRAQGEVKKSQVKRRLGLLGAIALALGCIVAILQSLAITRNVKSLSRAAGRIAEGDLSVRTDVRASDEIGVLAHQFNVMADRVQALLLETEQKAMLEKELDIARTIQETLLPPPGLASCGPVRLAGFFRAASICGGDFWHYHGLQNGDALLTVGDVTGHGVPSAMISAAAKSGLDTLINVSRPDWSLPYLLQELNKTIFDTAQRALVMTFLAVRVRQDGRWLEVVNGGHNFPILLARRNGVAEARALVARGNRLGDERESTYTVVSTEVQAGDALLLYSDGITEYRNPEGRDYGERRLRQTFAAHLHLEPDGIVAALLNDLGLFVGAAPQEDDLTLVVAKIVR